MAVKERLCTQLMNDPSLNSLAYRLAGNDKTDLMQEVALLICEKTDSELHRIESYFSFWCVRVMINMTGKRGEFTKKYRNKYIDADDWHFETMQDYDHDEDEMIRKVDEVLNDASIHWYKRDMFRLYCECGSLRKVEKEVGIPFVSVFNTVKEMREIIKERL